MNYEKIPAPGSYLGRLAAVSILPFLVDRINFCYSQPVLICALPVNQKILSAAYLESRTWNHFP